MRVLTVVPDDGLRQELESQVNQIPFLDLGHSFQALPDLDSLLRSIRIHKPDALIVSVQRLPEIQPLLTALSDTLPWLPIVGIASAVDEKTAHELMRLGVREYLVTPVTRDRLAEIAVFLQGQLSKHPVPAIRTADLYSFLPAKAGVGTTTIALSVSHELAEELSVSTLLMDCDLAAGIIDFYMKLGNASSIIDAIHHADSMDADLWRQMVARSGKLDVLPAGGHVAMPTVDPASVQKLLAVARAQYDVICADLPSELSDFSIELMRESQRVFLVTTPEVASVHLAKQRLGSLADLGLTDRVNVVVNRRDHVPTHLELDAITEAVGMPVVYCIGNDYETCSQSVLEGASIPSSSEIGKDMMHLAETLRTAGPHNAPPRGVGRKFLEFFHIPSHAGAGDWQR